MIIVSSNQRKSYGVDHGEVDLFFMKPGRLFYSILTTVMLVIFISPISGLKAISLAAPVPTYPENDAITTSITDPPLGIPSFTWSAVVGANLYHLQVDRQIEFNQPILDMTTQNTTYTPQSGEQLFSDGEWYWRVRVDDPPGGIWSPAYRFTKMWAAPENQPGLLSPTEGEQLAFFDTPAFSWTPVMGAARYRFQLANSPDAFNQPLLSVDTLSPSYQPTARLPNGIFFWRVVPMDAGDHLGTPSQVQSFEAAYGSQDLMDMVPALVTPEDESYSIFTPTFHWTAIKGAERYRLEFTTDVTCDFNTAISWETRQTFFTPPEPFLNALRYCWRVRVESGPAVGDWSNTWHFQLSWNLTPLLLTPTHQYQTCLYPLYSWTPVPGASNYLIQISQNQSFIPIYEESITANTTYAPQSRYNGTSHYYWRVTPIDEAGAFGATSDIAEFQSLQNSAAPILIYPFYYYPPNNTGEYALHPVEDRTVAYPIFIWHRVMRPAPTGGIYSNAYRLQVDDSPYFDSIDWQIDTENTSAAPTHEQDFIPSSHHNYYWRVCPLDGLFAPDCLENPDTGLAWWSQVWIAQFDQSLGLTPTTGERPELLRPLISQEFVEATPMFDWFPLQGATQYQIEVSRDPDFSSIELTETVNIPSYSPRFGLAQRSLGLTDYGTFYWHVRGFTPAGWGDWSDAWRFQIASQSEWRFTRSLGNPANRLLIGDDPAGDSSPGYDLTALYAAQSRTDWYLGFSTNISTTDMTYVFYIDLDNVAGSGGTEPPERSYQVSTIPEHQPEYVIYLDTISGTIIPQTSWVFSWNNNSWSTGQKFSDIGAAVYVSSDYVELKIPGAEIGMDQETSSASLVLFSINNMDGVLRDAVPSHPQVSETSVLSRFSAVSERMNLISPPSAVSGDPTTQSSLLPFFWDWPTGSQGASPFGGINLQVDLDQNYSPPHEATFQIYSNSTYFSQNNATLLNDILGNNIYYWRIQPRYLLGGYPEAFGAWTGGWSFRRQGFVAENLFTSINASAISFSWDMAEGASTYRIQVATDPNFGDLVLDLVTPLNSLTPQDTLPADLYYWRVQVIRYGNILNGWAQGLPFEITLPTPVGLTPAHGQVIHSAPTFCWEPIVLNDDAGNAVFTSWKYRVQVSSNPNFSGIIDSTDTFHHCWTPTIGYSDGPYYWRVAMIDGNNRLGPYSPSAMFTKVYPSTALISPISGSITSTPTFVWSPVEAAASYVIEVSIFPTFQSLYDSQESVNTRYTPTTTYTFNRAYYWRVAIRDMGANQGPFTSASFILGKVYSYILPMVMR